MITKTSQINVERLILFLVLVFSCVLQNVRADAADMQARLAEIRDKIETEREINRELKERLAVRKAEIEDLKSRLKSIEDTIASLKIEHDL